MNVSRLTLCSHEVAQLRANVALPDGLRLIVLTEGVCDRSTALINRSSD